MTWKLKKGQRFIQPSAIHIAETANCGWPPKGVLRESRPGWGRLVMPSATHVAETANGGTKPPWLEQY